MNRGEALGERGAPGLGGLQDLTEEARDRDERCAEPGEAVHLTEGSPLPGRRLPETGWGLGTALRQTPSQQLQGYSAICHGLPMSLPICRAFP